MTPTHQASEKHLKYPELDFIDQEIIDLWRSRLGENPDYWSPRDMLVVQLLKEARKLTAVIEGAN